MFGTHLNDCLNCNSNQGLSFGSYLSRKFWNSSASCYILQRTASEPKNNGVCVWLKMLTNFFWFTLWFPRWKKKKKNSLKRTAAICAPFLGQKKTSKSNWIFEKEQSKISSDQWTPRSVAKLNSIFSAAHPLALFFLDHSLFTMSIN